MFTPDEKETTKAEPHFHAVENNALHLPDWPDWEHLMLKLEMLLYIAN
jgi:hypothetical protein